MHLLKPILQKVYSLKQSSEDLLWFWKSKTGQNTNLCCEKMCTKANIEGTIVFCLLDNKNYVIPLCEEHRNTTKSIEIASSFKLYEL